MQVRAAGSLEEGVWGRNKIEILRFGPFWTASEPPKRAK